MSLYLATQADIHHAFGITLIRIQLVVRCLEISFANLIPSSIVKCSKTWLMKMISYFSDVFLKKSNASAHNILYLLNFLESFFAIHLSISIHV
jgi:hypothetical protein